MRSRSETAVEVARSRPLLGTFVEVRVTAPSRAVALAAGDAAFRAVERVHRRMSPREPVSDLSRLACARVRTPVTVDPWTWRVLAAARRLSAQSGGFFDVTDRPNGWEQVQLLSQRRVVLLTRLRLDLGGIAKGFAVDRAVAAARRAGASAGVVNAGGDLRAFGATARRVSVRSPAFPHAMAAECSIHEGAVATSSNALDPVSAGRLHRPDGLPLWIGRGSVTLFARSCMTADALCKVVAAVGPSAAGTLLRRYRAEAFILDAEGRPFITKLADAA